MATQLKQNKKFSRQIVKIGRNRLDNAIQELSRNSPSAQAKSVHNARKQLKQLRGILRLIRAGMRSKTYKKENRLFRDAGRPLSVARDADVMIETLDALVEHYQQRVKTGAFNNLKRSLNKRRKAFGKSLSGRQGTKRKVNASLKKARSFVDDWASIPNDYTTLLQGLEKTYSSGKKEMNLAMADTTVESLHQWRKSVKYLRYQLDILEPLWPPVLGPTVKELHHLADVLGLDHDFAVLEDLVVNECSDCCEPEERELLNALVNQRRQELQAEAFTIGPKLFSESPGQFAKRMKGYWKTFLKGPASHSPAQ